MSTTLNTLNYRAFLLNTVGSIVNLRPQALAITFGITPQEAPDRVFNDIRQLVEETTRRCLTVRQAAPELAVGAYWMLLAAGATANLPRNIHITVRHHSAEHRLFGIVSRPKPHCVQARKTTDEMRSLKERQAATRRRIQAYHANNAVASERLFRRMVAQLRAAIEVHPDPTVQKDATHMLNMLNLQDCKLVELLTLGNMLGLRLPTFTRTSR